MIQTSMKKQLITWMQKQANDCFMQTGRKITLEDWQGHIECEEFEWLFSDLHIKDVGDLVTYLACGSYQTIPAIRYFSLYSDEYEYPENRGALEFFVSYNEECPYKGVRYDNGEVWVYGADVAKKVDYDELEKYMAEG